MKSAPILSKHDMGPLMVNLDPKSHPVVGSPPNLREFGIHDSSDGQFTDVDTGLGTSVDSTEMVNGADLGLSYLHAYSSWTPNKFLYKNMVDMEITLVKALHLWWYVREKWSL